jgi:hypothetical protein
VEVSELASKQLRALSEDPSPEKVSFSVAMALWQIVKILDRIAEDMPHKPAL